MPWQDTMTQMLRYLLNDIDTPQTFTDSRLQTAICVGAQYLVGEIDYFSNTYQVDVTGVSISPDPMSGTKDNAFINLAVLRANVIVTDGLYRANAGKAGYAVKDGQTSVDTKGILQGYAAMMQQAQADYQKARWEFQAGVAEPGRAILAPFSSPTIDFRGNRYYDPRAREWL